MPLVSILSIIFFLIDWGFGFKQGGAIITAWAGSGFNHELFETKINGYSTFGINVRRWKVARGSHEKLVKTHHIFVFDFSKMCNNVSFEAKKSQKQGWFFKVSTYLCSTSWIHTYIILIGECMAYVLLDCVVLKIFQARGKSLLESLGTTLLPSHSHP